MKILSVIIGMCLFEIYNFLYAKDTFNKLGYKAEINNYTASRVN